MTGRRFRSLLRWGLSAVGGLIVLFVAAVVIFYLVDTGGEPRTLRNVNLAGTPAGRLNESELSATAANVATEFATTDILINLPHGTERRPAGQMGISVDIAELTDRALRSGRRGGTVAQFRSWLASFTTPTEVGLTLLYDRAAAREEVEALGGLVVAPPIEPQLTLAPEEGLVVAAGEPGTRVDTQAVVDRLGVQVEAGGPFDVDAPLTRLEPRTDAAELAETARKLNVLTKDGIRVRLGGNTRTISSRALRTRLNVEPGPNGVAPTFDLASLQRVIEAVFRDVRSDGENPTFDIVDDKPVLVSPGTAAFVCCHSSAASLVAAAVLSDRPGAVQVEPRPSDDPTRERWATGADIVEKVAEFTTEHPCCQARVNNIQRFADIMRGAYLAPGESLSLNEYVGERTPERGFVPAGTILQGHLVPTVGGGVSQFATTMFNAAFFAGFDFIEYQSHSIYFSRYPYGREATISWPAPDLEFVNTTPYPALIWTSYDDTSITVSIYSTSSVEVTELGQEVSSARQCTRVDTFRRRTYPDGTSVEDSVFATYRPGEGFDCNGNPTTKPNG